MTETQADHPDDITNTSHHTRREDGHRQTLIDLVKKSRFAMLTTRTAEGTMISRPLTVQEVTEEGDIYFIVPGDGDAAREADRAEVNLGFSHDMAFASVAGTGEILHDRDKLEQLWGIGTQAWSDKDETPQNTSKVVLVVHGETAQYWNAPSKPALAVGLLKGLLTDEKPASESGTTKL